VDNLILREYCDECYEVIISGDFVLHFNHVTNIMYNSFPDVH